MSISSFKDYLDKEKNYSVHTIKAYCDDLLNFELFNKDNFQEERIDQVNYSQIRSWIVFLVDHNISTATINRKISSLKAYYKFLLKTKQIEVNPFLKHKALKTPKTLQIPFSEREVDAVLEQNGVVEGFEAIRNKLIIDLLYTTGIRRAELIQLKVTDVDFSNKTIKVLGKRNKERLIPILSIVIEQMRLYEVERSQIEFVKDDEVFFISKKGLKLNNSFVYRLINAYFSKVSEKVKKSPHVLRHTFATHMLNNGADLNSVKELLGHSSLASTQVYTHSSLSELKKVYKNAHPRNSDNSK